MRGVNSALVQASSANAIWRIPIDMYVQKYIHTYYIYTHENISFMYDV